MRNFELKKRLDARVICTILYIFALVAYLIVGLQPVSAENYQISGQIEIPSINLISDVTDIALEDDILPVPNTIVGAFKNAKNKTFLVGHSAGVFENLNRIKLNDEIFYDGKTYIVTNYVVSKKADISMAALLAPAREDTLVIMTCAGEILENNDATHRLIVTAVLNEN